MSSTAAKGSLGLHACISSSEHISFLRRISRPLGYIFREVQETCFLLDFDHFHSRRCHDGAPAFSGVAWDGFVPFHFVLFLFLFLYLHQSLHSLSRFFPSGSCFRRTLETPLGFQLRPSNRLDVKAGGHPDCSILHHFVFFLSECTIPLFKLVSLLILSSMKLKEILLNAFNLFL
jgi:hypothetical protein